MFEVANALGAAIHVGDRSLWTGENAGAQLSGTQSPSKSASAKQLIERSSPTAFGSELAPQRSSEESPRNNDQRTNEERGNAADRSEANDRQVSSYAAAANQFEPRAATQIEADRDDGHSSWSAIDFAQHVIDKDEHPSEGGWSGDEQNDGQDGDDELI